MILMLAASLAMKHGKPGDWSETEQFKGRPIQSRGYWSTIYVREGVDWKVRMVIYNVTPATSG